MVQRISAHRIPCVGDSRTSWKRLSGLARVRTASKTLAESTAPRHSRPLRGDRDWRIHRSTFPNDEKGRIAGRLDRIRRTLTPSETLGESGIKIRDEAEFLPQLAFFLVDMFRHLNIQDHVQ